jgi:hypothetical protein
VSPGGRHGHKVRELRRRMDAVIEEERERSKPPPPPVSEEHAAMRQRIERCLGALLDPDDPDKDLDERIREDPNRANDAVDCLVLMQEEQEYLAERGVDPRPYDRYEPKF